MKALAMLTACAAIAAAVPAQAQTRPETNGKTQIPLAQSPSEGLTYKRDLASILCKELAGLPAAQVEQIVTWLQGFYTLENAPRIVNPDKIKGDVTKIGAYSKDNPEANLVAAADDVMGEP